MYEISLFIVLLTQEQAMKSEEQAKKSEEQAKKSEEQTKKQIEHLAGEVASLRVVLEKLVTQMAAKWNDIDGLYTVANVVRKWVSQNINLGRGFGHSPAVISLSAQTCIVKDKMASVHILLYVYVSQSR